MIRMIQDETPKVRENLHRLDMTFHEKSVSNKVANLFDYIPKCAYNAYNSMRQ
jgi:hypothetical protein